MQETTLVPFLLANICGLSKSDIKMFEKIQKKQKDRAEKEERSKVIQEILTELNLPDNKKNIDLVNKHASKHCNIQDFLNVIKNQTKQVEEKSELQNEIQIPLKNLPHLFKFLNEIPEKFSN